jgi:hypothetical protein
MMYRREQSRLHHFTQLTMYKAKVRFSLFGHVYEPGDEIKFDALYLGKLAKRGLVTQDDVQAETPKQEIKQAETPKKKYAKKRE